MIYASNRVLYCFMVVSIGNDIKAAYWAKYSVVKGGVVGGW